MVPRKSTCIVAGPEIVRAPVVVKVPDTLGKPVKSNVAVMVTGMAVEADAEGTEPIMKKAAMPRAIAAVSGRLVVFFIFVFVIVRAAFKFPVGSGDRVKRGVSAPNAFGVETSGDVIGFISEALPNECRGYYV